MHQSLKNQIKSKNGRHYKHGMTKTLFYGAWNSMKRRCTKPNYFCYDRYGGRGITLCERWYKFENFRDDMFESYLKHCDQFGSRQTQIERIDNNKGYSLENCKWATAKEQNSNRRDTRFLTFNGQTLCIKQWAESLGIKAVTIGSRLSKNWPIEKVLSTKLFH